MILTDLLSYPKSRDAIASKKYNEGVFFINHDKNFFNIKYFYVVS